MSKQKGVKKRSKVSGKQKADKLPQIPDRRAVEGMMADLARVLGGGRGRGRAERDPLDEAQGLMYEAWEASGRRRVELARRALAISPNCADAYVLLAEETARDLREVLNLYEKGVAAGERALGPQAFKEDVGHFWGILATRPYMRARAGLAQCLWALGEREAAIEHYRDLLRLNPNDNQGIRYILAACLLEMGRDKDLERLLAQYEDDGMAAWLYTRAIATFRRQGDSPEARAWLQEAKRQNPHVPAYLLGRKRLPRLLPEYIGFGDENEAISYAADFLNGWRQTPGALDWLAAIEFKR